MALFWLSDEAWAAIEPHLPRNQPGARRVDDRRVISGILHVLKVGCRWCDCPTDYGPSTTVYNRFNRWSRRGFWLRDSGAVPVIPGRRSRKRAICYDKERYRGRHLIENAFCRRKDFRRVHRYDKLAANFLSGVALATAIAFWL
ncbi:transposase [Microvirga brassicacearum]|uniref:Transposase n=1 Tax=Microvirga brassicacearum TaxID=2580413 RepID=A0A5N3PC10_9HYPH|nr:transposase [Microvirga brassicacearum]KAB0267234.1 transposase [Microvirga brassicacearum]